MAFRAKLASQTLHLKGFFPSWTDAMWTFKLLLRLKLASQIMHLKSLLFLRTRSDKTGGATESPDFSIMEVNLVSSKDLVALHLSEDFQNFRCLCERIQYVDLNPSLLQSWFFWKKNRIFLKNRTISGNELL